MVRTTITMPVARATMNVSPRADSVSVFSRLNTREARESVTIISTVPPTSGVTTRLRTNSHLAMRIWKAAVTRTRLVSVAGPPSTSAMMQNGMEMKDVRMGRTSPVPMRPMLATCSRVVMPMVASVAKIIQAR